jgi:hypothetical protein
MAKLTTKQRQELKLLKELQDKHGYLLMDMRKDEDKFEFLYNFTKGTSRQVRVFRLCVPLTSAVHVTAPE